MHAVIETSEDFDSDLDATAGKDYEHVSLVWSLTPWPADYIIRVPIVKDDTAEDNELFQVNLYDLIENYVEIPYTPNSPGGPPEGGPPEKRKRDTSSTFPCVKIYIVDDDGKHYINIHYIHHTY